MNERFQLEKNRDQRPTKKIKKYGWIIKAV